MAEIQGRDKSKIAEQGIPQVLYPPGMDTKGVGVEGDNPPGIELDGLSEKIP